MRFLKYLLIVGLLLGIAGCRKSHGAKSPNDDGRVEQLREAFDERLLVLETLLDSDTHWPSNVDCDGTLWAGLACSVGASVKIELAEYSPGVIHRRPGSACWTAEAGDVGSKSTVSRDMLLGYTWCLAQRRDLAALQRLADYGEKNNWVMGHPYPEMSSRVVMTPVLYGLLGRVIARVSGGKDLRSYAKVPPVYAPVSKDYEKHLQVLSILLNGWAEGDLALLDVNDQMLKRLEEAAAYDPKDALFQAALGVYSGDMTPAIDLLLSTDMPTPSYVRGENEKALALIHWLKAAKTVLDRYGN